MVGHVAIRPVEDDRERHQTESVIASQEPVLLGVPLPGSHIGVRDDLIRERIERIDPGLRPSSIASLLVDVRCPMTRALFACTSHFLPSIGLSSESRVADATTSLLFATALTVLPSVSAT